ncbi:MAG: T9SS type A sorting domain-containing protein [Candidatus Latescibacteria bacterium]|nr:T9SS type A sorting domain-containing protein [Candidatus Latescibacterota bacterium]NIM66488.1 T9SS type A sorting domain-containing protein [Candidatus Latescibacterota bacterium]NIO02968.1 T9SS type A sorting domain-containing protein [Candidatus Latescibacterota bacterium]NIO30103.1 T9SS type A sorting domain-containing protein [Candidatus Latescibacterota bacterium]NIO57722.1 T9SS type A sorting domain-containing protein [Candidatus Latescibacterota bacterium]
MSAFTRKTLFALVMISLLASLLSARKVSQERNPANWEIQPEPLSVLDLDRPLEEQGLRSYLQADTVILGSWTFDVGGVFCTNEGWTGQDWTAALGCYFHVDDFTGLDGGDFGLLVPLEGDQSAWCGARPDTADPVLCVYAALPGYGNDWDQGWCFKCIEVPDTEAIAISYLIAWDSEGGFDQTYLEYATNTSCDSIENIDDIASDDWVNIATFDGTGSKQLRTDAIPAGHDGFVKIRFHFGSDGAYSDQDGFLNTDGAVLVDSITVQTALTTYDFEDFEDESPGDLATTDGDWECCVKSGYGDFAGLFPGSALLQEDPCHWNYSCMWAFIMGSTETYACGGHPEQIAVPKKNEYDQYITNSIWSPPVALAGVGSTIELSFDVYRDLPGLYVYYTWDVRSWKDGCPGQWKDQGSGIYYGPRKDWSRSTYTLGEYIDPGASHIQIALGVVDMQWFFDGSLDPCHSHSPLFDNVEIRRISTNGPQWSARDLDLFQDTFPENGTSLGTGRIDAAHDIAYSDPNIIPGDSAVVTCYDPDAGLKEPDPKSGFGSAVYCYLSIDPPSQPGKMGDMLEEDGFRWPLVDSTVISGTKWYQFRCDTACTRSNGSCVSIRVNGFCIDVNDHLFTNGDTLYYFFGAENTLGEETYWSQGSGTTWDIAEAASAPMEMQILPGAGPARGGDILYVDQFNAGGAQPYFDSAFEILEIDHLVDRFDKRGAFVGPLSADALGYHVRDVAQQLHPNYQLIIWNSGDLSSGTVGDGSNIKADDFAMLDFFLDQHPNPTMEGIYFSGDDMAEEWAGLTNPSSSAFINKFISHNLVSGDHTGSHGKSPLVIGEDGGIFDHGVPDEEDTIVVYGGCPTINDFDVIQPAGGTSLEMTYGGTGLATDGAVVAFDTLNALGNRVSVVLSGFSFHYIRDDVPAPLSDRDDHLVDIIRHLVSFPSDPTGIGETPRYTNSLAQNYPNPFNPITTIEYSIKERAHVSLKVYNVAGQLVRRLVNEEKPAGEYTKGWNGRNDEGNPVSSGVYFYRIVTKNFTQTKKMILLK